MSEPVTPKERQKAWLHRALVDPDGLRRTRLQLYISEDAAANIATLRRKTGWTKRRVVEAALAEMRHRFDA
ncbi:hypothetical protein B1757_02835 [Acidithiobacillus marinus]|uniref:Ribbon-helix-helix protein CopG domain-containing protein n=1 Tax=Acidithiobacillus marinus TaxID=187490 RepID=A0A2I1DPE0_9PROT|nr:hypothetical protein [Acidithiobacillus marinus]PKY11743.1 hypothetical protein B1757_02835 [Acidithiobacillus marinus]